MGSIVWIASYPRSGNTWTRTFLHNLLALGRGEATAPQDINAMHRLTTWDIYPLWWKEVLDKPLEEAGLEEVAALRPGVHERIAAAAEGVVFVKTHNALVVSHGHPSITLAVTSGAIYLVRNPLDVVVSMAAHFGFGIERAIERLNSPMFHSPNHEGGASEVYGAWWQNVDSWTRKASRTLYVMRYEDMLERPAESFGALARHLTLRPTPDVLQEAVRLSSFEQLKQQEEEKGFVERPKQSSSFFRQGRSGQWRELLTQEQVARVVGANESQMRRFGYWPPKEA